MSIMERDEFAKLIGISYNQYTKYENNKVQPSIDNLWDIWERLRIKFPEINLQDLLEK